MASQIKFSSLSQKDLENSSEWYEEQLTGLSERFVETIYSAANTIAKNPESFPIKKAGRRQYVVRDYPFVIIYQFIKADNLVNITRIFHTSRNPKLKYKKSKN